MNVDRSFRKIVAFVKGKASSTLDSGDFLFSDQERKEIDGLWSRVSSGEPLEYVLGLVETQDLHLSIDRRVLIPRVETEILVEYALEQMDLSVANVLDLCSGSGILGLSIKKRRPLFSVVLVDVSPDALEVAKKNGEKNGLEVEYLLGDLFKPLSGRVFDYVLCNPPYISEEEYRNLDRSVSDFEPKLALVGGENGLFFYEKIAKELPKYLAPQGKVFFEMGASQGEDLLKIFSGKGWKNQKIKKDFAGLDRFFFVEKGEGE